MFLWTIVGDFFLVLVLLLAVVYDQREQRIPNLLILIGLIAGLVWNVCQGGLEGLLFSLKGFAAGLGLLFIPFAMGGMGAGDVKLLAVVGTFKGYIFAFHTFIYMALWGGFIAVILLVIKGKLGNTLRRLLLGAIYAITKTTKLGDSLERSNSGVYFPYALAIALGAFSTYYVILKNMTFFR